MAFTYDALGRRISKTFAGTITRWVWDGDTPLHEWSYDERQKPRPVVNEWGVISYNNEEPNTLNTPAGVNGITWLFEEGSHMLVAKIVNGAAYSVICDHLGTPQWMYDASGKKVWEGVLDIYGRVRTLSGSGSDMPFRYQGQYEDVETGLCYNRFRYYDPQQGNYISQDPIGLAGGNPTLYGYVKDPNVWVDPLGLECGKAGTATIHKYDGDASNPYGHFSIEINHNGKKMHTHQVITSHDHSTTTIIPYSGKSSSKSVTIDIPDAEAAQIFQKSTLRTELGPYSQRTNSCVDHVSEVLRAGGADVQKSAIGQFKYLKSLGLF